jgi:hypothetical protein
MVHVVSALRTILDIRNHLFDEKDNSYILGTVFLNNLSSAATDASHIQKTLIVSNQSEQGVDDFLQDVTNKTELQQDTVLYIQIQDNQSAIDVIWDAYQSIVNQDINNVLIGGINVEGPNTGTHKETNLTKAEIHLRNLFYEKSLQMFSLNYFSDEIVPFEDSRGKTQGELMVEDGNLRNFNQENVKDIPLANGAAGIFLANDEFVKQQHVEKMATIEHFFQVKGSNEELSDKVIEKCRQLNINENWVVEMDYFDFHAVTKIIEESRINNLFNIVNPSGGSIILGNSKGLSGFRAIVSLANQMKRKQSQRGLAIILNDKNDTAYLVVLKQ